MQVFNVSTQILCSVSVMASRPFVLSARGAFRISNYKLHPSSYSRLTQCKRLLQTEPSVKNLPIVQHTQDQRMNVSNCRLRQGLQGNRYQKHMIIKQYSTMNGSSYQLGLSSNLSHFIVRTGNFSHCIDHSIAECSSDITWHYLHTGDFQVIEDFITIQEENVLMKEIEHHFSGARYEYDHWDNAIHGYRETEKSRWRKETQEILQRVRSEVFSPDASQLPLVHVLDLAEDGYIKPHVDSVKFCGPTIAGLSLLSPSVVKLISEKDNTHWLKALLPSRSLYIMRNDIRYDFTHEIMKDDESVINGKRIRRGRRVSVMFRDHPAESEDQQ